MGKNTQQPTCLNQIVMTLHHDDHDVKRKLDGELNHRPARNNSNYLLISNCPSEDNKTPLRVWALTAQTDRRTQLSKIHRVIGLI